MLIPGMILVGEAKVYRHTKGKTLYVSIPSKLAQDSAFTIREGDSVDVVFDKETNSIIIKTKKSNSAADKRLRD